jgi:predicted dehydrogenase
MDQVNVAVSGCGSVAWIAHFPAIARSSKLKLVGVFSRTRAVAEKAAHHWGARHVYRTFDDLVADKEVDAVIVASPNVYHFEQASSALSAGRHVYIEKPMTSTNTQAWDLVRLASENHRKLTVGCQHRFWTQHRWARKLIAQGVVGQVRLVRSSLHETWHLYQENVARSDYRLHPSEAVAGTLFDQGSHRIDLISWLVDSRPRRVVGVAKNVASPELGPLVDDLTVAIVEYENGAHGILTTDKFSPVVSNITEVYGTAGMMFASSDAFNPFQSVPLAVFSANDYDLDSLPEILQRYRYPTAFWVTDFVQKPLEKRWMSIVPPRTNPFDAILEDFADAILLDREPDLTGEDGAYGMEVLCGVLRSMETGGWVDLPLEGEVVPPALRAGGP